jgi:outer membrane receptor protein involved in Fe transport
MRVSKKLVYKLAEFQLLSEYFHEDLKSISTIEDVDRSEDIYDAYLYDNRLSIAGVLSSEDRVPEIPNLSWKTFLGTRADFLASGPNDWSLMVGAELNHRTRQWLINPYFNWGQNVKYPSLEEAAFTRDILDFTREDSTADRLKPEYNISTDLGLKSKFLPLNSFYQNMEITVSLFSRTIYNKLIKDPFTNIIVINTQLGRNITRGVEGSLSFNGIFNHFTVLGSFMYLDISDPLIYSFKPEQKYSLHLRYNPGSWLYISFTPFYEGKSIGWRYDSVAEPADNIDIIEIEPFYDMDFSIGTRIKLQKTELDLQFSGNNIFDNYGFTYYYLKKKYLQVSLAVRY